jgi:hypothetical protein
VQGGELTLITLDELIKILDVESIETLRTEAFPVPYGFASIISGRADEMWIRYNAEELSFYCRRRAVKLSENQEDALRNLAEALSILENNGTKVTMSPGQCLVIDNKRALHGRTSFPANGKRLLKRLRLHWT